MANVVAEGAYPYCRLTDQPLSVDEVLAAVSGPEQGGIVIFVETCVTTMPGMMSRNCSTRRIRRW